MNRETRNKILALGLAAGMIFGSFNIPMLANHHVSLGTENLLAATPDDAATPEDDTSTADEQLINNMKALKTYLQNTMPDNTDITKAIADFCSPMTTAASIYNSGTLFLKMAGVMKDPTAKALTDIQTTLANLNVTIQSMNETLNRVAKELQEMDVYMREADRAQQVQDMITTCSLFDKTYVKELNGIMDEYQNEIIKGFKEWYNAEDRDGISIYFAKNADGNIVQVYSYENTEDPKYSTEGFQILKEYTVHISKEQVNHFMSFEGTFNVDTYRDNILEGLCGEIYTQAYNHKLDAGSEFYNVWDTADGAGKKELVLTTAEQAFNALASGISKDRMENCDLSGRAYSTFCEYCNDLTSVYSSITAEMKILFLTHGFEGEVKDQVKSVLDSFGVSAGAYATMTLSMMHQNSEQSTSRINRVIQCWTDVTNKLESTRNTSLTGYDNYCYITNSLVNYQERTMEYSNDITLHLYAPWTSYRGDNCTTGKLLNDDDIITNEIQMTMLYHLGKGADRDMDFSAYLKNEKVINADSPMKKLVSDPGQWIDFSPGEGIYMNQGIRAEMSGDDYWGSTFTTTVNKWNSSGIEDKYFHNCKVIRGTMYNTENDTISSNSILAAMAAYGESHTLWFMDEAYLMGYADSYRTTHEEIPDPSGNNASYKTKNTYQITYGVLTLSQVPVKIEEDSPIAAYDYCQVVQDFSDMVPTQYEVNTYEYVNPDAETTEQEKCQAYGSEDQGAEEQETKGTETEEQETKGTETEEPKPFVESVSK